MRSFQILLLLTILLFFCSATNNDITLPVLIPDEEWQPLRERLDPKLQQMLEKRLYKNKRWAYLLKKNRMAVGLVDMTNPAAARFANVNGESMLYAASLPKIAILLSACQAFEDKILNENADIVHDLNGMIKRSENASATRMIDRLGYKYIEKVVRDPRYKLFDPEFGGGLWIGKRYARYGGRYPDPIKNLVHAASATQVCRFYYLLATGRLVNPVRSRQMLYILSDPEVHHKFVHALDGITQNVQVYRKSGTWRFYHSDSMLVWGPDWRRYILVALVEDRSGEQIMRDLLPVIEQVLKERADSY